METGKPSDNSPNGVGDFPYTESFVKTQVEQIDKTQAERKARAKKMSVSNEDPVSPKKLDKLVSSKIVDKPDVSLYLQGQQPEPSGDKPGLETELEPYINPEDFTKFMREIEGLDPEIIQKLIEIMISEKKKLEEIKKLNEEISKNGLLGEDIVYDTFNIQSNMILNKLRGEIITSLEEKIKELNTEKIVIERELETKEAKGASPDETQELRKTLKKSTEAIELLKTQIKQMSGISSDSERERRKYMKYKLKYLKLKNELKNRS